MLGAPIEANAQLYQSLGMSSGVALRVAEGANDDMGRAILALYRSATQPVMKELGTGLERAAKKPGLVLIATEDHYCGGEALARRSAKRARAEVAVLEGAGHWWMSEQPEKGARVINAFLAKLN